MALKDRIKEARQKSGYTQAQLAGQIGVTRSTVDAYEAGVCTPGETTLGRIMEALEVDANYLWQDVYAQACKASKQEIEHMEKYRALDAYGRETISYLVDREIFRVSAAMEPSLGFYGAPSPSLEEGSEEKVLSLPDTPGNRRADYALQISDDSMEPDYCNGDIVLVSKKEKLRYGDVGIFIVGSDTCIKEYGKSELISRNPKVQNIKISGRDSVVCMGKVIGKTNECSLCARWA